MCVRIALYVQVCVCVCERVVRHSGRIMEAQYASCLQVTLGIQDSETLSTSGFFLSDSLSALCLSLRVCVCVCVSNSIAGVSFLDPLHLYPLFLSFLLSFW